MIAVRYTEGVIRTQLASDIVTFGTAPPPTYEPLLIAAAAGSGVNSSSAVSNSNTSTAATNGRASTTPTTTTTTTALVKSDGQKSTSAASSATPAGTNGSRQTEEAAKARQYELGSFYFSGRFRGQRTFGLTTDISGDSFLPAKEVNVPGFLGASQGRFESDSGTLSFSLFLLKHSVGSLR